MFDATILLLTILFIVLATTVLKLHPFLALITAAFGFGLATGMPAGEVVSAVNQGFGGTIGYIGIVILAGSIIGTFLEKSGGAKNLALSILDRIGKKKIPGAMSIVGYVVSIPIFCDTAFILLSPVQRMLSRSAGVSILPGAVALALGLYVTHTMIPPTPGPVAATGIIGADLGLVALYGIMVSAFALMAGWLFSVYVVPRVAANLKEVETEIVTDPVVHDRTGPKTLHSLLPIIFPIVLIIARSYAVLPTKPFGEGILFSLIEFTGQPIVALLLGVVLALTLPKKLERKMLSASGWVGEAIASAAPIIIITGAGGAFGKVLQLSDSTQALGEALATLNLGIFLPFIIAAALKTAQGSSTVAIITTASLMAPLLGKLGLDSEASKALVVVVIGSGSMVISHVNDSFFWIVTQLSNMSIKTGFMLISAGTAIQGTAAAIAVWILNGLLN